MKWISRNGNHNKFTQTSVQFEIATDGICFYWQCDARSHSASRELYFEINVKKIGTTRLQPGHRKYWINIDFIFTINLFTPFPENVLSHINSSLFYIYSTKFICNAFGMVSNSSFFQESDERRLDSRFQFTHTHSPFIYVHLYTFGRRKKTCHICSIPFSLNCYLWKFDSSIYTYKHINIYTSYIK